MHSTCGALADKSARMKFLPAFLSVTFLLVAAAVVSSAADAIPAASADGRVLNLGFEDGTLRDGRRRATLLKSSR